MSLIYSILIRLYALAIRVSALFNPKAKAWLLGRKNWQAKLRSQIPENRSVIWFHCASLGEYDQGLPLMKAMKEKDPTVFLLVSFFSPSGMEHYQKREPMVDAACYLPIDTKRNAREFLQIVRPEKAVFVKYEFWPCFLAELARTQVETIAVSAIFRDSQIYFRWYGAFFSNALRRIQQFYLQNEESAQLLHSIGITKTVVTGDLRFERVLQAKELAIQTPDLLIESFQDSKKVLILGSSWPIEEELLAKCLSELEEVKVIIAPHDVSEKHIESILNLYPMALRYSVAQKDNDPILLKNTQVLILDSIGKLSAAYRYGSLAFIGGGFTGNLHNILEPAVYGLSILFGPKHVKFPEAKIFLQQGFAREVGDSTALLFSIRKLLDSQEERSVAIQAFISSQQVGSQRILAEEANKNHSLLK